MVPVLQRYGIKPASERKSYYIFNKIIKCVKMFLMVPNKFSFLSRYISDDIFPWFPQCLRKTSSSCWRLFQGICNPVLYKNLSGDISHLPLFGRKAHYHLLSVVGVELQAWVLTPLDKICRARPCCCGTREQGQTYSHQQTLQSGWTDLQSSAYKMKKWEGIPLWLAIRDEDFK